jgi:uncharacterized protein
MEHTIKSLALGLSLLLANGSIAYAQNFGAGAAAYQRGDYETAFREISVVAEQGNVNAQYILAAMYVEGQGVTQDYREAAKWFRLSAEQGDRGAQFSLGQLYRSGQGVTQDYREAAKWFRSSAEQGQVESQNSLGTIFFEGHGVTQDYVYAHMWFNIAAASGDADAVRNRAIAAGKMTAADISKAQDLARACVQKNYKGC